MPWCFVGNSFIFLVLISKLYLLLNKNQVAPEKRFIYMKTNDSFLPLCPFCSLQIQNLSSIFTDSLVFFFESLYNLLIFLLEEVLGISNQFSHHGRWEISFIFSSSVICIHWLFLSSYLLLLLLSRPSRVQLCATPEMAAHLASPSLGFSRQEHWSGLPFPSPMHESEKWKWSRSVVPDS